MDNYNISSPELELKLNLSPSRPSSYVGSPNGSAASTEISTESSCVSREISPKKARYSSSPETTSMMLVGCPRCLMYVMLMDDDRKCPKCKSSVLLDFLHEAATKKHKK